jgi:hypothetical protein
MLGPTAVRRVWRYDIRSEFDVIPTLRATYLNESTDYIRKLFKLTHDLLTSLGMDDCNALFEEIMRDLGEALTNRVRVMTFLHAFVKFFEPHDSGRLSLFAHYKYFGHVEALSILKCLIIMNEEETLDRHSIPFLFHPTTIYSIIGRLCDDGRLSEQGKQQFLNNTEFQAAIIEAANHLMAIKVCFDELVMILGVKVDEANNYIVAGKWEVPADFPNDALSLLQCIDSNVLAPYRSMARNDAGDIFESSYENLLETCYLSDLPRKDYEWINKVFRFRYKHIPTFEYRPKVPATGGIKKKRTYKHRSQIAEDFQCMVPKQYASAEKENEPTDEDEDDSDSDWWSHLDDDDEKMM